MEKLQRSFTAHRQYGPLEVKHPLTFADELKISRVTVTIRVASSKDEGDFRKFVRKYGINVTEVTSSGEYPIECPPRTQLEREQWLRALKRYGLKPETVKYPMRGMPRTISFSCKGDAPAIDRLTRLYMVESFDYRDASVPYVGSGQGAPKGGVNPHPLYRRNTVRDNTDYKPEAVGDKIARAEFGDKPEDFTRHSWLKGKQPERRNVGKVASYPQYSPSVAEMEIAELQSWERQYDAAYVITYTA